LHFLFFYVAFVLLFGWLTGDTQEFFRSEASRGLFCLLRLILIWSLLSSQEGFRVGIGALVFAFSRNPIYVAFDRRILIFTNRIT
jgi:hypothetical protein